MTLAVKVTGGRSLCQVRTNGTLRSSEVSEAIEAL